MEELKTLLDKGVLMEDNFIQTYIEVIKDEGFFQYFMAKEKEAKELVLLAMPSGMPEMFLIMRLNSKL